MTVHAYERARVAAVVLAAGSSTRMGRNKLLLDLGGETLVRRAVRAAVDAGVDEVVVVLGHEEPRVRAELGGVALRYRREPRSCGRGRHVGADGSAARGRRTRMPSWSCWPTCRS